MIYLTSDGDGAAFRTALAGQRAWIEDFERDLKSRDSAVGYCNVCDRTQVFTVDGGPDFGAGHPNLREGLVCPCGAKNRDRLMVLASRSKLLDAKRTLFFGAMSAWAEWARINCRDATLFCEYLDDESTRGAKVMLESLGFEVCNEDLTAMSFADCSADIIVHQDVLEHIPDFQAALRESFRVLKPGGSTIFTAPFFDALDEGLVRARLIEGGVIEHLLPEERHGDPLSPEGILAFYNFGWDLLAAIRQEGFEQVTATLVYSPDLGLVSNGCPAPAGNMLPIYISAVRPA